MPKLFKLLTGFIALAVLLSLGWYSARPTDTLQKKSSLSTAPDATITQLRVRQYNADGELQYRLYAPKMQHYAKSHRTEFFQPVIGIARTPKSAWIIRAERADALDGNQVIELHHKVVIHQPGSAHNIDSLIRTDFLAYHTQNQIAETDHEISLEQPGLMINARGLRADIANEQVSLLAKARGKYDKQQRQEL